MSLEQLVFLGVLAVGVLLVVVVWLQRGVIREQRARRLAAMDAAAELRQDLDTARDVERGLRRELDATLGEADRLRQELEASKLWNRELRTGRAGLDELVNGSQRHRNERRSDLDRERAAWISKMRAAWNAPTRRPPHDPGE